MLRSLLLAYIVCTLSVPAALAQSAGVNFGGLSVDPSEAVEVSADSLSVDQTTDQAVFSGNVKIAQGALRLSADRVQLEYADSGEIDSMIATGNVVLVTATEAAEAQNANYSLSGQTLVLTGDVLLTQGSNALLSDSMRVDLATGNAVMDGRVRTVLQPSGN